MRLKIYNPLIFICFSALLMSACGHKMSQKQNFEPYLEDVRALQIPQWEHENWYIEDWTSQKSPDQIVRDLYKADIFKDQMTGKDGERILIVGPNFYHLSGLDKRKVVTLLDYTYQPSADVMNSSFFLKDWKTKQFIGVYDRSEGLRLH